MYFYELHEGDDEVFADLLLARAEEMPADVFFETVQAIRRRVQDSFDQDTLIEAIAEDLERDHDFIYISDRRLTAAANVSTDEAENFLADLEAGGGYADDEDDDEDEDEAGADYRTLTAEFLGDASDTND